MPKVRGSFKYKNSFRASGSRSSLFSSIERLAMLLADCSQDLKSVNYENVLEFHALASPANFHADVEL